MPEPWEAKQTAFVRRGLPLTCRCAGGGGSGDCSPCEPPEQPCTSTTSCVLQVSPWERREKSKSGVSGPNSQWELTREALPAGGTTVLICAASWPGLRGVLARAVVERLEGNHLPEARVAYLKTARDCTKLELAVAQAWQSSQTLQEECNHKRHKFRQFLFSASTQLQANRVQPPPPPEQPDTVPFIQKICTRPVKTHYRKLGYLFLLMKGLLINCQRQATSRPKTSTSLRTRFKNKAPTAVTGPAPSAEPPSRGGISHLSEGTVPSSPPGRQGWHSDHPPASGGTIQPPKSRSKRCTPSLAGEVFQPSDHFCGPPPDPFQQVHVFPVLRTPELDAVLQVNDLPFDLAEIHKATVSPFLQLVYVPPEGSPALKHVTRFPLPRVWSHLLSLMRVHSVTSSTSLIVKFEQDKSQYGALRYSLATGLQATLQSVLDDGVQCTLSKAADDKTGRSG
ncbi:hypothetical protein QYF61_016872 [Mycteria americana]|uniref:Uncharacterized protein n=1 Tax=Mycteria americana TaxID=33587 RepID=A0AAN7PDU0_MYCAM|nr:hypothetical protein QYF61_016872 [Mycteria americana]